MPRYDFNDAIEWPGGGGYTPCTAEYARLQDMIDALNADGTISMDEMSPAEYQEYNTLLDKQNTMLADGGWCGKGIAYGK